MAIGAGLVEIWCYKWYVLGGLGVYITLRTVKRFVRTNSPDVSSALAATKFATESADAAAVLGGYVKEVLKRKDLDDLDVCTVTTNFGSLIETKGAAVGCYCVEHLHLKVINHLNHDSDMKHLLDRLNSAFESLSKMLVLNARMGYRLTEQTDKSRYCILSKDGQAIGMFVTQDLSKFGCWDCCDGSIQDAVIVAKGYDKLSFMAAQRLSDESAVHFDTISDGPEFVVIACDGVCNLMENMDAVRFVYQAARADMELRPLCDVLLDGLLSSGSSVKVVAVLVQFKARHMGEGSSVNV
ncbi:probable protein phosphatase 2C 42 [Triticum dicoccoides]|uniref:probable protein phosphatase 2C 42 n=1 Tax=Triticum dicoccoides TaxID=85692 RepID=UPI0018910A0B|nr:probable protein phosphatase 2C 42 [Triticum dicoccoides]